MTDIFACGDHAALVSYLYDENSAEEREVIATHLAGCATCARELASLGDTRQRLSSWTAPHASLDIRVGSHAVTATPPHGWWRQPLPAWMQVAAAALLFVAGVTFGIAGGSSRSTAQVGPVANLTPPNSASPVSSAISPRDLTQLEERLRAEMTQLRTSAPVVAPTRNEQRGNDDVLTQVRTLIAESEERQRRELALRTVQIMRDVENQRRADLTQVQRTWDQVQGLTGAEVQQQRELLNALARRVSLQR